MDGANVKVNIFRVSKYISPHRKKRSKHGASVETFSKQMFLDPFLICSICHRCLNCHSV